MANTFTVSRGFDRKNGSGGKDRIGIAEFTVESKSDIGFMLNGAELPASSVDHLLTFALQSLQDAYAGADDAEDAQIRFDAKLARILAGTLGTRSGGTGVTALVIEIRNQIRAQVAASVGKSVWKDMEADERDDAVDAVFAAQSDDVKAAVTAKAEAAIVRKMEEKADKKALGAQLVIKL